METEEIIAAHEFFLILVACNNVIPMAKKSSPQSSVRKLNEIKAIDYQGESPDEQALVNAASTYGYTLLEQTTGHVIVNVNGKKMRAYTLVIATRDLTDEEFEEWYAKYELASISLTERSAKLHQAAALVERNLDLLGATAIEDKLQDGVPEAIESLRQAAIRVWVLTGDKQETVISIGLLCRLLTHDMHKIIINGTSEAECRCLLADAKANYRIKSADDQDEKLKLKLKKTKSNKDIMYHSHSRRLEAIISGRQNLRDAKGAEHESNNCSEHAVSSDISLALIVE